MSIRLNFTQTHQKTSFYFLDRDAVATCSRWTQEEDDVTGTGWTRIFSSTFMCAVHRLVGNVNNDVICMTKGCGKSSA